jgi:hypothetical protein
VEGEGVVSRPIRFWKDWQLWDEEVSLKLEGGGVEGLQFVGDSVLAALTVAFAQSDEKWQRKAELTMWNLEDGTMAEQKTLPWDTRACVISSDGRWLAVAIAGGRAQVTQLAR